MGPEACQAPCMHSERGMLTDSMACGGTHHRSVQGRAGLSKAPWVRGGPCSLVRCSRQTGEQVRHTCPVEGITVQEKAYQRAFGCPDQRCLLS